jgi:soluble lytic murein transglycosylase-like protein
LIDAVIKVESAYKANAVSKAGAKGLMQLMKATAAELGVRDRFDARQNIFGGSRYLKDLINRFEGRLDMALAAYNAGPSAVEKYNGIPPYRETQRYVRKIMDHYKSDM